jgi:DNA-binding NarL/FixJ family response regulator
LVFRSDSDEERAGVLFLIKSGMDPAEIAAITGMTEERVGTAIDILCKELGVTSRIELLLLIYSARPESLLEYEKIEEGELKTPY